MVKEDYYNIALIACDVGFTKKLIKYAQENFFAYQKDYILNNDTLPHITLCQFRTAEEKVSLI